MEEFIESISDAVGSACPTLLRRLHLDSGTEYKIEMKFPSGEGKFKLRAKEALNLWQRKPSIRILTEEEQKVQLLELIHDIEPLRNVFTETSLKSLKMRSRHQSGATLVQNIPSIAGGGIRHYGMGSELTTSRHQFLLPSEASYIPHRSSAQQIPSTLSHEVQQGLAYPSLKYTASVPLGTTGMVTRGSAASYCPPIGTDNQLMPPCTQTNGFTTNMESTAIPPSVVKEDPCEVIINIQDRYHKFALLDASRRILRGTWNALSLKFNLPDEVKRKLEQEKDVNERYYKLFVQYVRVHKEKATFGELRRVLLDCDERLAVAVIEERLRSRKDLLVSAIEYDFLQDRNI